jgi:anti-sigma regulatory factor (Ser/Thr protein kinase)
MNERLERDYGPDPAPEAYSMVGMHPGRISIVLGSEPRSIVAARRAVDALIAGAEPSEDLRFRLRLVVSELVTNAILHGAPNDDIQVELSLHRLHAQVCVTSGGALGMTRLRRGRPDGGRGLEIVAALAERWTIDTSATGTAVTARVSRS